MAASGEVAVVNGEKRRLCERESGGRGKVRSKNFLDLKFFEVE